MSARGLRSRRWSPPDSWKGEWELPGVLDRPISEEDRDALVALSCGGVGPGRLAKVLRGASSVTAALERHTFAYDPTPRVQRVAELGARAVVPSDDEYPPGLTEDAAPPPLLYVRGERLDRLGPCVAIVGARACTEGAARFTRRLACAIAEAGFCVVSGLARGIDGAAHTGALQGGRTCAVLGTGIERVYPAEHRDLAAEIVVDGALVTEFPPGTGPRRWHFPARNRIIAAMSFAVIVVEAGTGSGALITVEFALEGGREVYACVTGPENPAGEGIRDLIREGAEVLTHVDDAVERLCALAEVQGLERHGVVGSTTSAHDGEPELDGERALVYKAVTETTTVERVAEVARLPVPRVASVLAGLELDGHVVAEPGGRWSRPSTSR